MKLGSSLSGCGSGSSLGGGLGPICRPSRSWAASGVSEGLPWFGGLACVGVLGDPAWLRWLRRSCRSSTKAGRGWWGPVVAAAGWSFAGRAASGPGSSGGVVSGLSGCGWGGSSSGGLRGRSLPRCCFVQVGHRARECLVVWIFHGCVWWCSVLWVMAWVYCFPVGGGPLRGRRG